MGVFVQDVDSTEFAEFAGNGGDSWTKEIRIARDFKNTLEANEFIALRAHRRLKVVLSVESQAEAWRGFGEDKWPEGAEVRREELSF